MSGIPGQVVRLRRRLGLAGNPLRRRSDRMESWLKLAAFGLFVVGCAVAVLIGHAAYRSGLTAEQRTAHTYRVNAQVVAVTAWATARDGGYVPGTVRVVWFDRARVGHVQEVVTPAYRGQTVRLWADRSGHVSLVRHTHRQTVVQAVISGISTTVITACVLVSAFFAALLLIDHRRFADWDREWLVVEPGWRRQEL